MAGPMMSQRHLQMRVQMMGPRQKKVQGQTRVCPRMVMVLSQEPVECLIGKGSVPKTVPQPRVEVPKTPES